MKSYIGTKVIKATEMTKERFEAEKNNCECGISETEGYKVLYEDDYVSWSPKEVFERCYREITIKEINLINREK